MQYLTFPMPMVVHVQGQQCQAVASHALGLALGVVFFVLSVASLRLFRFFLMASALFRSSSLLVISGLLYLTGNRVSAR